MSSKIDGGVGPAPRVLSHPSTGIERAGNERSKAVGAVPPPDQVRLTGEATALQAMQRELASEAPVDHARVAEVRTALESGSYRISPEAIATALLRMEQDLG